MTIRKPYKIFFTIAVCLALSLYSVFYVSRCQNEHSVFTSREQAVKNLEAVLPLLKAKNITNYRYQDWCSNIRYLRGAFSDEFESTTCNLFSETPKPFDSQAKADFDELSQALGRTGLDVIMVTEGYRSNNSIAFVLDVSFNRMYYVYEPNHRITQVTGIPNELMYTPINANWYQVDEDWN